MVRGACDDERRGETTPPALALIGIHPPPRKSEVFFFSFFCLFLSFFARKIDRPNNYRYRPL